MVSEPLPEPPAAHEPEKRPGLSLATPSERAYESSGQVACTTANATVWMEGVDDQAAAAIARARTRARQLTDTYPLHLVAVAASTAFLMGLLLRIWRSGRDA